MGLEDKESFISRNNLADKLGNRTALENEVAKQIKKLAEEKKYKTEENMKYINPREPNKEVFRDTMRWLSDEAELKTAVALSVKKQFVWKQGENFPVEVSERISDKKTRIFTSSKRTFEAADFHAKAGKKVAVLNFANKPEIVAHAAYDALKYYEGIFQTVEFAVFATQRDTSNYKEFVKVFGKKD